MSQKKPTLGRGLADLLGQTLRPVAPVAVQVPGAPANGTAQPSPVGAPSATGTGAAPGSSTSSNAPAANSLAPGEELARLPLDLLQKGKYQPRIDMRPETLQELADSIKAQGVVQPIVVRPVGVPGIGESQRYEIIAGERRWRAAQMAGLNEIPAVIRRIPDEAAIAVALIENIQRENLNPLEEARALERLISEFELTHQEAADAVGRSRTGVTNLLRLLELAPEVCERVERREIDMGHARTLAALTRKQQVEAATLVVKRGLSVRDTEALVRRMLSSTTAAAETTQEAGRDPNVQRLEQELAEKLGAKVAIQHSSGGKGKLVVAYNSLDELDGILAHIQ
jgi:ParB family transcriptional regulator, chromosome partitioning protein